MTRFYVAETLSLHSIPQSPPPSFGTAAFDADRGAGSEVSAGGGGAEAFGEVRDTPNLPREISPWWLLIVVAGFLIAARFEVIL